MKVLAIVCSHAGEKSHTKKLCNMLYEAYDKEIFHGEWEYECITLDQLNINFCRSCSNCFKNANCPLEKKDDIGIIKQKILDCDVLLMGSPVYIASITGSYKNLADRLAVWCHTFTLAGKICIPVSTTSGNHLTSAADIIARDMACFGCLTLPSVCTYVDAGEPLLFRKDQMEPVLAQSCCELKQALANDRSALITDGSRILFEALKRRYVRNQALMDILELPIKGEALVWQESGFGDYADFDELINHLYGEGENRSC